MAVLRHVHSSFSLLFTAFALVLLLLSSATAIDALHHHHRRARVKNGSPTGGDLAQILSRLGFRDLATAAPALAAAGPSTVFAPSDASLRSCGSGISCSVTELFREHVVGGLFTFDYLQNLDFGAKIETLSSGRCLTVTSSGDDGAESNHTESKKVIFIGGVEITEPDLFNDGIIVVHGLRGFIAPLSPFSCDVDRTNSLSFPFNPDHHERHNHHHHHHRDRNRNRDSRDDQDDLNQRLFYGLNPGYYNPRRYAIMRLMIRDAMFRLRGTGYSILALAMRIKYPELVRLHNMTMFAISDVSIFTGMNSYVSNIRFHIVPNAYLTLADLEKLPLGTIMPTLSEGQSLVVTTGGIGGLSERPMRINYVRIRIPEVIRNLRIVVHSLFLPFPHINSVAGFTAGEALEEQTPLSSEPSPEASEHSPWGSDPAPLPSDEAPPASDDSHWASEPVPVVSDPAPSASDPSPAGSDARVCSFAEAAEEGGVCIAHEDELLGTEAPAMAENEEDHHGL